MKIQSAVMHTAHEINKTFKGILSWSKILKEAWRLIKLELKKKKHIQNLLRAGEVSFSFIKKDGSKRPAKGTLNVEYTSTSTRKASKCWYIVNFFDLEKNAWRCLDIRNLVAIY